MPFASVISLLRVPTSAVVLAEAEALGKLNSTTEPGFTVWYVWKLMPLMSTQTVAGFAVVTLTNSESDNAPIAVEAEFASPGVLLGKASQKSLLRLSMRTA